MFDTCVKFAIIFVFLSSDLNPGFYLQIFLGGGGKAAFLGQFNLWSPYRNNAE